MKKIFLLPLIPFLVGISFSFSQNSCVPVPSGIVSWWAADGNADDIADGNNGTLMNGATFGNGKVGQAFILNGAGAFVNIPTAPNLNPSGSFTIEGWINSDLSAGTQTIALKWGDAGNQSNQRAYGLLALGTNGDMLFGISDDANQWNGVFHTFVTPAGVIQTNTWHHVAGVYDQTTGTRYIYVNGLEVAQRTDPPITLTQSTTDLTIGAYIPDGTPSSASFPFKGMIDELALYDRVLTQTELLAIYNAGSAGKCKTPGSSCANAIDLGQGDTCVNNFTMTDTLMWFKFVADSQRMRIIATTTGNNISDITIYNGTCNGLNVFANVIASGGDDTLIVYNRGFVIGNTYFVKVTASPGNILNLCKENVILSWDDFALLAGAYINSPMRLSAFGNVGAMGTISDVISSSDSIFSSGNVNVSRALSDLGSTISQFNNLSSTTLTQLNGQTLVAGTYQINGNTFLTDDLTLSGDSTTTYIFRINGDLTIADSGMVFFGNVNPKNIFWIIDNDVLINQNVRFYGNILGSGNIAVAGNFPGILSMLSLNGFVDVIYTGKEHLFFPCAANKFPSAANPTSSSSMGICPKFIWAKLINGSRNDIGRSVSSDPTGNSYATGIYGYNSTSPSTTCSLGSFTLTSKGYTDIYVAKYNPCGVIQWAAGAGGTTSGDEARSIATDVAGNSYITGYSYSSTLYFYNSNGTNIITLANTGKRIFVAKINSLGIWQWAVSVPQTGTLSTSLSDGYGIDVDNSGNVYITGVLTGSTFTFGSTTLTGSGGFDAFVAKLDASSGAWIWAKKAGGTGFDWGESVAVDAQNNILVSGHFGGVTNAQGVSATFGSVTLTPQGNGDIFVTKLDASGNFLWAVRGGCTSVTNGWYDMGYDIQSGISTNGYVTGNTLGPATFGSFNITGNNFTAKIDGSGNWLWVTQTTSGGATMWSIDIDASENSYLTGSFNGTVSFGSSVLTGGGVHFASLNSSGAWQWALKAYTVSGAFYGPIGLEVTTVPGAIIGTGAFWDVLYFGSSSIALSVNFQDEGAFLTKICTIDFALSITANGPTTFCQGGSIVLTANVSGGSPTYTYLWSTGATSPSITVSTSGTYVVTVTDGCGNTLSAQVIVTVNPLPPAPVISGNISDCTNPATYTITNYNTSLGYSWNVTNGSIVNTLINTATIQWSLNSSNPVGIISVTAIDANGCSSVSNIIYVYQCCATFPVDASFNNTSATAANTNNPGLFSPPSAGFLVLTNKKIDVNGVFVIDQNLILTNCTLKMGIEARIEILAGCTLSLQSTGNNRTWLRAGGCDKMWDGIYILNNTAHLICNSSSNNSNFHTTIQNARNAIVSQAGGDYQLSRTVLQFNNIDIIVNTYGNHPGFIRKCILRTGTSSSIPNIMLPYFTAAVLNNPLPRTNIGIQINTVGDIQIGDPAQAAFQNLFDKMDYGIYATVSKFRVYNNWFQNINTTTPLLSQNPNGIAVYLSGKRVFSPPSPPPMGITVGGIGLQANTFTNTGSTFTGYGVRVENFIPVVDVLNNLFTRNNFSAVFVSNCRGATININNNVISETPPAPFVFFGAIACIDVANSSTTIAGNFFQDAASTSASKFTTAISVRNVNASPVNLLIQNNTINFSRTGISLIGVTNSASAQPLVKTNTVTFVSSLNTYASAQHCGIRLQGCTGIIVDENIITRNGAAPNSASYAQTLKGISVENSFCIISENDITKMGDGIFGFQACGGTVFACNILRQCYFGFDFQGPANINPDQPNQFTNNCANPPCSMGNRNQWINNVSAGFKITGALSPSVHWYYHTTTGGYSPSPFLMTLLSSFFTGAPELAEDVTAAADVCALFIAPPPPATEQQREAMFGTTVRNENQYVQDSAAFKYAENKFTYRYFKQHPSVLNMNTADDSLYQNFYSAHQSGSIGIFEQVQDLAMQNNCVSAIALNASAPTSCTIESNQKTVNEIYLKTWAEGILEFTSTDSAALYNIAYQNPLSDGYGVYGARVMLNLDVYDAINGNRYQQTEIEEIEANTDLNGIIYPNPANEEFTLEFPISETENGELELYSVLGMKAEHYKLLKGQSSHTLSAIGLQTGIYFYKLNTNNETVIKGKIIIIK